MLGLLRPVGVDERLVDEKAGVRRAHARDDLRRHGTMTG
jgi:hypothetical protein